MNMCGEHERAGRRVHAACMRRICSPACVTDHVRATRCHVTHHAPLHSPARLGCLRRGCAPRRERHHRCAAM